jgi:hypothetical protein
MDSRSDPQTLVGSGDDICCTSGRYCALRRGFAPRRFCRPPTPHVECAGRVLRSDLRCLRRLLRIGRRGPKLEAHDVQLTLPGTGLPAKIQTVSSCTTPFKRTRTRSLPITRSNHGVAFGLGSGSLADLSCTTS